MTPTESIVVHNQNILKIGTINAQSVKNKDNLLRTELLNQKLDVLLVTETWLNNKSMADDIWGRSTCLNENPLRAHFVSQRENKRGGGIGLIYKDNIKINNSQLSFKNNNIEDRLLDNKIIQF